MINKWKRKGLKGRLKMSRGQDPLIVVLPRGVFKFKTSLGSKRAFKFKFLPSSLRLWMIGFLTLSLRREGVLVH